MENASKALLIAAGVMLAIMLLSVIFIFGNQMASYFSEKHDAKMIEQLVEFNNKFQNYDGKTIAIVAHRAPQLALEVISKNITWEEANKNDWRKTGDWQPGWTYEIK